MTAEPSEIIRPPRRKRTAASRGPAQSEIAVYQEVLDGIRSGELGAEQAELVNKLVIKPMLLPQKLRFAGFMATTAAGLVAAIIAALRDAHLDLGPLGGQVPVELLIGGTGALAAVWVAVLRRVRAHRASTPTKSAPADAEPAQPPVQSALSPDAVDHPGIKPGALPHQERPWST